MRSVCCCCCCCAGSDVSPHCVSLIFPSNPSTWRRSDSSEKTTECRSGAWKWRKQVGLLVISSVHMAWNTANAFLPAPAFEELQQYAGIIFGNVNLNSGRSFALQRHKLAQDKCHTDDVLQRAPLARRALILHNNSAVWPHGRPLRVHKHTQANPRNQIGQQSCFCFIALEEKNSTARKAFDHKI